MAKVIVVNATLFSLVLAFVISIAASFALPVMKLPVGNLKDFAIASDASSLSQDYPKYKDIISRSMLFIVPTPLRVGDGFARVYSNQSQASVDVPFGWLVFETWGIECLELPDKSVGIMLRSGGGIPFSELRAKELSDFNQIIQTTASESSKDKDIGVAEFDTDDGGFILKGIIPAADKNSPGISSGKQAVLVVFTPHPRRPDEWKTATLFCAPGQLEKYEPLLGAILQSRDIAWDQGWSYAELLYARNIRQNAHQLILGKFLIVYSAHQTKHYY